MGKKEEFLREKCLGRHLDRGRILYTYTHTHTHTFTHASTQSYSTMEDRGREESDSNSRMAEDRVDESREVSID